MEESSEQILNHLAVIHRFMAIHTVGQEDFHTSNANVNKDELRIQTIAMSDDEIGVPACGPNCSSAVGGASVFLNSMQVC